MGKTCHMGWTKRKTGLTSDDNTLQTVHLNYLKFGVQIVLYRRGAVSTTKTYG